MFEKGALTILHVKGVPIRLHWSALLLVPLLMVGVGAQAGLIAAQAGIDPAALTLPGWAWGALAAVGLLISIALHELAHTFVALRHGGKVDSIVLMALGGVSQVSQIPRSPRHELIMALVGPLVSIALGVVLALGFGLTMALPNLAFFFFVMAYLNFVLGIFNLLPALPMDGGRVLRAALAIRLGKPRATRIASGVAKVLAAALGIAGVLGGGFWLLLIAAFVWMGASQEKVRADIEASVADIQVGDLRSTVPEVDPAATVEMAREMLRESGSESLVVVENGQAVGVIRKVDVLALPPEERGREQVHEHMVRVHAMAADDQLGDTFDRVLREGEVPLVDAEGHSLGVVRSGDVMRKLAERNPQLRPQQREP